MLSLGSWGLPRGAASRSACKPRSVQQRWRSQRRLGDHLSGTHVTVRLVQPTQDSDGTSSTLSLLGLAPDGVCLAASVARSAGVLLPHRFTLTNFPRGETGNIPLCCTMPSGSPAWLLASILLYGARTFLRPVETGPRSPGQPRSRPPGQTLPTVLLL